MPHVLAPRMHAAHAQTRTHATRQWPVQTRMHEVRTSRTTTQFSSLVCVCVVDVNVLCAVLSFPLFVMLRSVLSWTIIITAFPIAIIV